MITGISIFRTRLSPLFDNAQKLLLVNHNGPIENFRETIYIGTSHPIEKIKLLKKLNIEVLICGAISRRLLEQIMASGIKVIPRLSGEYEEILHTFKEGKLSGEDRFLMPGCCRRQRRRCRGTNRGRNTPQN